MADVHGEDLGLVDPRDGTKTGRKEETEHEYSRDPRYSHARVLIVLVEIEWGASPAFPRHAEQ